MTVWRDVDVRRADEFDHFLRADKAVVEDDVRIHADVLRQVVQVRSILVAFTTQNVRVSRARDHVDHVLMLRQDVGQCLNNVFDSFIGRQ